MTKRQNRNRISVEAGLIEALALQVGRGITAQEAADELGFQPTRAAVELAAQRLTHPTPAPPADPFAGLPR